MECWAQDSAKKEAAYLKEDSRCIPDMLSVVIYCDQSIKHQNSFFGLDLVLQFYWSPPTNTVFVGQDACARAFKAEKLDNAASAPCTKVYQVAL